MMRGVWIAVAMACALAGRAAAEDAELRAQVKAQQQELAALRARVDALAAAKAEAPARPEPPVKAAARAAAKAQAPAQDEATPAPRRGRRPADLDPYGEPAFKPATAKWYDKLRVQGYTQVRHSAFLDGDRTVVHDNDPSIRPNTSLIIRRARLIFLGNPSDRVFVYFQPDFGSTPGSSDNGLLFGQLRDAYVDLFLTADHDWRLRVGQSKVPYSWEALQSSGNRLPIERNDAVNSATLQERDLGAFVYWAPKKQRDLLIKLRNNVLKGSGEYGVVGFGVANGQGANRSEANDDVHAYGRVTWPHEFDNGQIIEGGVAAYSGKVVARTSTVRTDAGDVAVRSLAPRGTRDQRANAHFVLYPQPFGLQAEYNVGRGPELDLPALTIGEARLHGGYVQAMYKIRTGTSLLFPFLRYQKYDGAEKLEVNAPATRVREWDLGVEWQPSQSYEVALQFKDTDRTDTINFPYVRKEAQLLQLHLQFNY